jgi:hypothetical protein
MSSEQAAATQGGDAKVEQSHQMPDDSSSPDGGISDDATLSVGDQISDDDEKLDDEEVVDDADMSDDDEVSEKDQPHDDAEDGHQVENSDNPEADPDSVMSDLTDVIETADENPDCHICLGKKEDMADYTGFMCGCIYCNECLNQALRLGLTTRALYPPKCSCRKIFDIPDIHFKLDEDVVALSEQVPEEWSTRNPTYCGREGCGVFMPTRLFVLADGSREQFAACTACNQVTCSDCKQMLAAHENLCGKCPRKMVSEELYAFVKENGLTRCPGCKTLVELEGGCNAVQYVVSIL